MKADASIPGRLTATVTYTALAILVWVAVSACSPKIPETPPHLRGQSDAADTDAEPVPTFEFYDSPAEAQARDTFLRYRKTLTAGDLEEAKSLRQAIDQAFDSPAARHGFWKKAIPSGRLARLTLGTLCPECTNATCVVCAGAGSCTVCEGDGVCRFCKGDSIRQKSCVACVCRSCSGTGGCSACRGYGKQECPACRGAGSTERTTRITCNACGGDGYRDGLRGPSGRRSRSRCLTCKGQGSLSRTTFSPCSRCGNSTKINCSSCGGGGRCRDCAGSGRRSECSTCGAKGYTLVNCPTCGGNGQCQACEGMGKCPSCRGSGTCPRCHGTAILELHELAVDTDWLNVALGYKVVNARDGRTLATGQGAGEFRTECLDRGLDIHVDDRQLLWISTEPVFDGVNQIFKPTGEDAP